MNHGNNYYFILLLVVIMLPMCCNHPKIADTYDVLPIKENSIVIDGISDDAEWNRANVLNEFLFPGWNAQRR